MAARAAPHNSSPMTISNTSTNSPPRHASARFHRTHLRSARRRRVETAHDDIQPNPRRGMDSRVGDQHGSDFRGRSVAWMERETGVEPATLTHSVSFGASFCRPFAASLLQGLLSVRDVASRLPTSIVLEQDLIDKLRKKAAKRG